MKKAVCIASILMTLVLSLIPAASLAVGICRWIDCPEGKAVHVHSAAGGKVLYSLAGGTPVLAQTTVPTSEGWVYITSDEHTGRGFVRTRYLTAKSPDVFEKDAEENDLTPLEPYMATVQPISSASSRSGQLHVSPDRTAQAIRRLSAGQVLEVIASSDSWSKVYDTLTGRTGYVRNALISR